MRGASFINVVATLRAKCSLVALFVCAQKERVPFSLPLLQQNANQSVISLDLMKFLQQCTSFYSAFCLQVFLTQCVCVCLCGCVCVRLGVGISVL